MLPCCLKAAFCALPPVAACWAGPDSARALPGRLRVLRRAPGGPTSGDLPSILHFEAALEALPTCVLPAPAADLFGAAELDCPISALTPRFTPPTERSIAPSAPPACCAAKCRIFISTSLPSLFERKFVTPDSRHLIDASSVPQQPGQALASHLLALLPAINHGGVNNDLNSEAVL